MFISVFSSFSSCFRNLSLLWVNWVIVFQSYFLLLVILDALPISCFSIHTPSRKTSQSYCIDIVHACVHCFSIVKDLSFVSYLCLPFSRVSFVRATEKNLEECIDGLRQELKYSLELEGSIWSGHVILCVCGRSGGFMVSALVFSSDRAVRVRVLAGTVVLSTKRVPANLLQGVTLRCSITPHRGSRNAPSRFILHKLRPNGPLGTGMQALPCSFAVNVVFEYLECVCCFKCCQIRQKQKQQKHATNFKAILVFIGVFSGWRKSEKNKVRDHLLLDCLVSFVKRRHLIFRVD